MRGAASSTIDPYHLLRPLSLRLALPMRATRRKTRTGSLLSISGCGGTSTGEYTLVILRCAAMGGGLT